MKPECRHGPDSQGHACNSACPSSIDPFPDAYSGGRPAVHCRGVRHLTKRYSREVGNSDEANSVLTNTLDTAKPCIHVDHRPFQNIPQAVQKGQASHPPSPGAPRRGVPQARPQQAKRRGGTYQASLEPLASITCERIGTLPSPSVRGASEVHAALNKARQACERRRDGEAAVSRENAAGGLYQQPANRFVVVARPTTDRAHDACR